MVHKDWLFIVYGTCKKDLAYRYYTLIDTLEIYKLTSQNNYLPTNDAKMFDTIKLVDDIQRQQRKNCINFIHGGFIIENNTVSDEFDTSLIVYGKGGDEMFCKIISIDMKLYEAAAKLDVKLNDNNDKTSISKKTNLKYHVNMSKYNFFRGDKTVKKSSNFDQIDKICDGSTYYEGFIHCCNPT